MESRFTKLRYKIKEVSEILEIPQSTLRFWETEFPDLQPHRTPHNQRYYTPADLELLEIIYYLLYTKGLKIEAAKEYLAHNRKNISKRLEIIKKLEHIKSELEGFLQVLNLRAQSRTFARDVSDTQI
ncbi:MAG: MerR family transcriptional regulator [Muribaculaceae bacterium]|nr:MerR family transcriptional regulator [Muribaculaceae bacterium]